MNKIINVFMLMIIMMSFVQASNLVPVSFPVSLDFDDPTDFTLIMPGGYEKHYYWDINETHTDSTFQHTIYYEMNNSWCGDYVELKGLKTMCESSINQTSTLVRDAVESKKDREIYERMYNICEERRVDGENESEEYKKKFETCDSAKNVINNKYVALQQSQTNYKTCEGELKESVASKNSATMFALAFGLGIGYWMWGKKKKSAPSEQQEAGMENDTSYFPEDMPGGDDEPHQPMK